MTARVVTLIGGPADLQRHTIEEHLTYYRVAVIPKDCDFDRPVKMARPLELLCETACYRIVQVDRSVWVGVHEGRGR